MKNETKMIYLLAKRKFKLIYRRARAGKDEDFNAGQNRDGENGLAMKDLGEICGREAKLRWSSPQTNIQYPRFLKLMTKQMWNSKASSVSESRVLSVSTLESKVK